MTVNELKKYIFDNNKIEYVLQSLGCSQIEHHDKGYYSACQPDGDNPQGVNIKENEYLNYRSFSRGVSYEDNQDIISLVEYIKKCSFKAAIQYLAGLFNIKISLKKENNIEKIDCSKDILSIFTKYESYIFDTSEISFKILDEDILNDYTPLLHISWLREGIMPWARKKFGIYYSYRSNRIIIPLRHWLTGELLGTNSRTTVENYKELGIKKYFITPTYPKSNNIYGLFENYDAIQKAGYVVVYESEKSPLKRFSLGDETAVAIQGHSLSEEQARILIGLNVDIIIAMDNDVCLNDVRFMCEKLYHTRNVYYLNDNHGLLGEKDSPADNPKVFNYLMKYKKKYDAAEHREYEKCLNKR